jgi:hypothetical protein
MGVGRPAGQQIVEQQPRAIYDLLEELEGPSTDS